MFPETPEALAESFASAISSGDAKSAAELWLEDATIVQPDGIPIEGRQSVLEALQALVDVGVRLEIDVAHVFVAGDVAVMLGTFTLSRSDSEGRDFSHASKSSVVYSRRPEGWRIAIDSPWGLPTSD